ncbi:MAG: replication-associated recombination protein A [Phycisphaerae bacterium]
MLKSKLRLFWGSSSDAVPCENRIARWLGRRGIIFCEVDFAGAAALQDLFSPIKEQRMAAVAPLPQRMRPRTLNEFIGQEHILGPGKLLRRMIEVDRLTSLIFYGPPGTGKTTLAQLIASSTRRHFAELNAAASGVREVRDVLAEAQLRLQQTGQNTVLFLDEIHRFNRAQQDILLTDVERGVIVLVGATTENPFFSVNAPLVSRSQIFQFQALEPQHIQDLLLRAAADKTRGFPSIEVSITKEALRHWVTQCDGDARRALLALELAVLSTQGQSGEAFAGGQVIITEPIAAESIQRKAMVYDPTGDEHYDSASALIKSMRGSDPDAAVYWLARMLEAGEDPLFIARRIAIFASEDIGNAAPMALVLAAAAVQAVQFVGMPECRLTLSQAVTYMACTPKSNSATLAISEATRDVRENRTLPVPRHLRDSHYAGAKSLGHEGYKYPHDFPEGYVPQVYLGVEKHYYLPTDRGHERELRRYLEQLGRMASDGPCPGDGGKK